MYIITQDISISLSDFHMVLYSVSHKNRPLRHNPLSSVYFINNLCVIQSETSMIRRRFLLKHTDDKKIIKVDTYDLHRLNLDTAYFIGANFSNPPPPPVKVILDHGMISSFTISQSVPSA